MSRAHEREGFEGKRIRNRVVAILGLVGLAVFVAGCASLGFRGDPVPPEQRAAYQSAMGMLPADPRGAEQALEDFLETYPSSLLADDACEQIAQLALASGRDEEGRRWLGRILSRYADGDRAASARLRLAQLEYARDKRTAARSLLEPLELDRLSLTDQRAALRLYAALSRTPMERLERLTALRGVLVREALDRRRDPTRLARLESRLVSVDREIGELIERAASAELEAMLRGLRGDPPAAAIGLALARRALDGGQLDLAAERIDTAEDLVQSELERSELRFLQERLVRMLEVAEAEASLPPLRDLVGRPVPSTADARGTLGVVLPLSGDFAEFGQESLRGILLAADLFASSEAVESGAGDPDAAPVGGYAPESVRRPDVRLIVRDSEGDPLKAAAHVRAMAADPSLLAVLGPIFSQESLAAAAAAEEAGVPLIALSTRQDLPAERAYAFRTRTTPTDEIGALVGHAVETLGAQRFAVLYPETRYGRGMRKIYWEEVAARGGKIVAASSYDPDAVDFATAIRDMIGYRFLTSLERQALDEREEILRATRRLEPEQAAHLRKAAYEFLGPEGDLLPPIVDFDVLFVPDVADKVALIAPGLAFHEIRGVGLLGSSDWLDEELLRVARNHVRGAVISSPFHPSSDLPFVVDFVEGYRNTFDAEPDVYAAEAFDAARLVLVQMSAGRDDRSDLRAGLLDTRAFPGATGVLTMHPDGNARRRPFLLRVSGRRFVPLD